LQKWRKWKNTENNGAARNLGLSAESQTDSRREQKNVHAKKMLISGKQVAAKRNAALQPKKYFLKKTGRLWKSSPQVNKRRKRYD